MLARRWRKEDLSALWVGMQTGAATGENSMEFPQKIKMELPFDLAILLLGIYPKKSKKLYQIFIVSLFITIAKIRKQPRFPSVDEWIKKLWYIYTREYYLAIKREELLPFAAAWMDLESGRPVAFDLKLSLRNKNS